MSLEETSRTIPAKALRNLWKNHRDDVLALFGIVVFFIVFFSWTLFPDRHVVVGDARFYNYPLRMIAWQMIRSGDLPLWTPTVFSGYPLLSMAQLGLGYPLTWGYLFLPGYLAEKLYVLAPFLLAPIFTYLYLRTISRSWLASLLGALTFGYGGMMASPLANNGLVPNAAMWLPLLLIAAERARSGAIVKAMILATFAYSMSVLTGVGQGFVYIGALAFLYALFLAISNSPPQQRRLTRWAPLLVICVAGLFSIGIAAFQILETWEAVQHSVRSTLTYELFTQGSYKLEHLWKSFHTPIFYVIDMHAYVPPLAAILAWLAFRTHFRASPSERDTRVFFWSAVAVLALVLMMGAHTRLYLIVYYIPILNLFRVPSRHTIEWTFAAGVLAAYGWDALSPLLTKWRNQVHRPSATTLYLSVGLLLVALAVGVQWWIRSQTLQKDAPGYPHSPTIYHLWKASFVLLLLAALWRAALSRSERWRPLVLGVLIFVTCFVEPSLLVHRWWAPAARSASFLTRPSEITNYLRQFPASSNRIYTRAYLMSEDGVETPRFDSPNLSGMWGLHEVGGYEPLILQRYSQALGGAWLDGVHTADRNTPDATLVSERSQVLDLLNTTFLVSYSNLATSPAEINVSQTKPSDSWKLVYQSSDAQVMQNSRALPRAWLVAEAESVSKETALRRIRGETGESFDPRRTALLEVPQNEVPQLPGGPLAPGSTVTLSGYEPNKLTIDTTASTNTLLVVSELFFPGWEVTVDGQPVRMLLTNYLLRGVPLTAGQHRVEMRYRAPRARMGALISVLSLGLFAGLALALRRWLPATQLSASDLAVEAPATAVDFASGWSRLRRWTSALPAVSREILIFGGFLAITAVMTWPWVLNFRHAITDPGDPYVIAWTLWWDYYQTFHDPLRLFHAPTFYPFQYTLAFTEHDYGIALFFFPLFALGFKPLTVHSVATFVGFAFSGYGAFRLTRTLTGSTAAGWIAGIVFAFIPYRFQLMSHLHYLFAGWLPLTLEALVLYARERSWRRAAWLGAAFLMNALTCVTWMIYALLPLAVSTLVLIARYRLLRNRVFWLRAIVTLAFSSLLLFPFLWPYYKAGKLYNFSWPPAEAERYSIGVSDLFSVTPRNQFWNGYGEGLPNISSHLFPGLLAIFLPLVAVFLVGSQGRAPSSTRSEQSDAHPPPESDNRLRWVRILDVIILLSLLIAILGIGYNKSQLGFFRGGTPDRALVILLIAIVWRLCLSYPDFLRRGPHRNLIDWLRSPRRCDGYWLGFVWLVAGFLTAVGPSFFLNRVLNDLFMPYRSLRIPGRAAMIGYVGLALLAGLGAKRLTEFFAARRRPVKSSVVYAIIIVLLGIELSAAPLAIVRGEPDPDALTIALKQTRMRGGLVELPSYGPYYPLHYAMLRATEHRHPLVNAASTFTSPFSRRIDELTTGPVIPTNLFLDFLEQVPASYVAVRHRMILPEQKKMFTDFLTEARNSGRLRLVGSYENGDELFVVTKTEPEAR